MPTRAQQEVIDNLMPPADDAPNHYCGVCGLAVEYRSDLYDEDCVDCVHNKVDSDPGILTESIAWFLVDQGHYGDIEEIREEFTDGDINKF